jgi:WD40 repeat protein
LDVNSVASPCGVWFAKIRSRQNLAVHAVATAALAHELPGSFSSCCFRPDGKVLAVLSSNSCQILETQSWQVVHRLPLEGMASSSVSRRLAFSRDGCVLAVPVAPGVIKLLETAAYGELARLHISDAELQELAFSENGAWLMAGAADGVAHLIDLERIRGRLTQINLEWRRPPAP